jgi:hypothetical protein
LVVILVAAAAWSAYWYVAAREARAGFESWFAARRAEGWQAEYASLSVQGYPNRVDTTFDAPALADPETGLAWSAPWFQIFALSYKPNHIIAAWPETQVLSTPDTRYDIASTDMRASLVMAPETTLPLERSNLVAGAMTITPAAGNPTALTGLQLAVNRVATTDADYRLAINADGLAPPAPRGLAIAGDNPLPTTLDTLRADLTISFDRPWDITALERARPQPTRIRLKLAEAKWGGLELMLAGTLDIDASGRPTGRLTVKAKNWRDMLAVLHGMGWLSDLWATRLEQGLSLAAQLSGNPNSLDLPLDFSAGSVSLGPISLGDAPVLRLR